MDWKGVIKAQRGRRVFVQAGKESHVKHEHVIGQQLALQRIACQWMPIAWQYMAADRENTESSLRTICKHVRILPVHCPDNQYNIRTQLAFISCTHPPSWRQYIRRSPPSCSHLPSADRPLSRDPAPIQLLSQLTQT